MIGGKITADYFFSNFEAWSIRKCFSEQILYKKMMFPPIIRSTETITIGWFVHEEYHS